MKKGNNDKAHKLPDCLAHEKKVAIQPFSGALAVAALYGLI
jgi:hypothetical protein